MIESLNFPPDVRQKTCPSQGVLSLIGDKWSTLLIYVLDGRSVRYLQLQREVGGISQKMLTQTLQSLERHGLVVRRVFEVIPPRVEYSLTPLGQTLVPKLYALCAWCEASLPDIERAKAQYDKAH